MAFLPPISRPPMPQTLQDARPWWLAALDRLDATLFAANDAMAARDPSLNRQWSGPLTETQSSTLSASQDFLGQGSTGLVPGGYFPALHAVRSINADPTAYSHSTGTLPAAIAAVLAAEAGLSTQAPRAAGLTGLQRSTRRLARRVPIDPALLRQQQTTQDEPTRTKAVNAAINETAAQPASPVHAPTPRQVAEIQMRSASPDIRREGLDRFFKHVQLSPTLQKHFDAKGISPELRSEVISKIYINLVQTAQKEPIRNIDVLIQRAYRSALAATLRDAGRYAERHISEAQARGQDALKKTDYEARYLAGENIPLPEDIAAARIDRAHLTGLFNIVRDAVNSPNSYEANAARLIEVQALTGAPLKEAATQLKMPLRTGQRAIERGLPLLRARLHAEYTKLAQDPKASNARRSELETVLEWIDSRAQGTKHPVPAEGVNRLGTYPRPAPFWTDKPAAIGRALHGRNPSVAPMPYVTASQGPATTRPKFPSNEELLRNSAWYGSGPPPTTERAGPYLPGTSTPIASPAFPTETRPRRLSPTLPYEPYSPPPSNPSPPYNPPPAQPNPYPERPSIIEPPTPSPRGRRTHPETITIPIPRTGTGSNYATVTPEHASKFTETQLQKRLAENMRAYTRTYFNRARFNKQLIETTDPIEISVLRANIAENDARQKSIMAENTILHKELANRSIGSTLYRSRGAEAVKGPNPTVTEIPSVKGERMSAKRLEKFLQEQHERELLEAQRAKERRTKKRERTEGLLPSERAALKARLSQ